MTEDQKNIVYRMQDKDGRGPWKPGFSHKWVIDREDHENLIPWTEEFSFLFEISKSTSAINGCACMSLDQLRRWFTRKEYKKLKKYGYRAVRMSVDHIIAESEIQCIFGRLKPLNMDINFIKLY